jgi:hypothetical protein
MLLTVAGIIVVDAFARFAFQEWARLHLSMGSRVNRSGSICQHLQMNS